MSVILRPFQQEGVRKIYDFRGRALLCDEMGLGKTIQALYWISKIPRHRPVVIVSPASVKYSWQSEAWHHFRLHLTVIEGFWKEGKDADGDVVVLNYDLLKSWLPALLAKRPRCVIFDEGHYLKSPTSLRTRAAFKLVRYASSVLILSGTPLPNRPIELWPLIHLVRPDLFPSMEDYAWRYCRPRHTRWGWVFDGAMRTDELRRTLRRECMIRRLKKDVASELPPKTKRMEAIRLPSYKEYRFAETDFLKWLSAVSPTKARRAKKSQALTRVGYLLRLVARLKLPLTIQWIEEFQESHPGEKLVLMSMHTFVLDALKERFPASVVINGAVTGRLRVEAIRRFQSHSKCNLLLGNWKAAGVGLNLQVSFNLVGADFPWTPGDLLQGEDRVHRIGQDHPVTVFYLTALRTIEEKLVTLLRKKAAVLDAVLDHHRGVKDLDLFGELIDSMR